MDEADRPLLSLAVDRMMSAAAGERASLAAALGLRAADVDALRRIERNPGITPTSLTRALHMSSGGTTAVVDRLEAAGLVSRTPSPTRRRRVALQVTERGAGALAGHRSSLAGELSTLTAGLTPGQLDTVERFVLDLAGVIERHAERLDRTAGTRATGGERVGPPVLWG